MKQILFNAAIYIVPAPLLGDPWFICALSKDEIPRDRFARALSNEYSNYKLAVTSFVFDYVGEVLATSGLFGTA